MLSRPGNLLSPEQRPQANPYNWVLGIGVPSASNYVPNYGAGTAIAVSIVTGDTGYRTRYGAGSVECIPYISSPDFVVPWRRSGSCVGQGVVIHYALAHNQLSLLNGDDHYQYLTDTDVTGGDSDN